MNNVLLMGGRKPYWRYAKSLFGTSVIEIWPLSQNANGVVNGLNGVASNVIFDSGKWAYFNGSSSSINLFSTGLRDVFNGQSGSLILWSLFPSSVWTDGILRRSALFQADSSNRIFIDKSTSNNTTLFGYVANGTVSNSSGLSSFVTPFMTALTWSKADNYQRSYINSTKLTDATGLGAFAGNLAIALLGNGAGFTSGYLSNVILLNRPATQAEITEMYNKGLSFF